MAGILTSVKRSREAQE